MTPLLHLVVRTWLRLAQYPWRRQVRDHRSELATWTAILGYWALLLAFLITLAVAIAGVLS